MLQSLRKLLTSERPARPLFDAVVAAARQPHWYRSGSVPDTVEGRFAMLATLLALVILRLEAGGEAARRASVSLTECFIAEMDGEVRQMGIGDPTISKQVGAMVGALGRRIGRFRALAVGDGGWDEAVLSSIFRESRPNAAAAAHMLAAVESFQQSLERADDSTVMAGAWA